MRWRGVSCVSAWLAWAFSGADREDGEHHAGYQADREDAGHQRQDPGMRRHQPPEPAAAPKRAKLATVGEDVTLKIACVVRDLDVEWPVPARFAVRIQAHLRRSRSCCPLSIQYGPTQTPLGRRLRG